MVSDSEPNGATRKTLDDIRRELEAEFGHVEIANPSADVREVADDPRPRRASFDVREPADDRPRRRASFEAQAPRAWSDGDDVDDTIHDLDDTTDASVPDFRAIADRHERPRGRGRAVSEERPRRSGYLIAAIVGCVAGQALLVAFFTMTRSGSLPDVVSTIAALRPRNQAPASAPVSSASDDAKSAAETPPPTDVAAASSPPATTVASPAVPPESKPESSDAVPSGPASETRVSSPPRPAVVSVATVPSVDLPPRVPPARIAREPRVPSARPPAVASAHDWAQAQAQLRSTLNQWLKASAQGGTSVSATEPVIVLNADGRTAKTYVSITSPIGLIPREQRWELGPRGWDLVEDRQAGLPQRIPTRER